MNQGDALEFFDDVVGGEDGAHAPDATVEYVLEAQNGRELTIELVEVDRKFVINKLAALPDEMLEMFTEVDDPEEAQARAEEEQALGGLSGDAIESFEDICAAGMEHPQLTEHHFEDMVSQLSLEVLFEMGAEIIELSLEDDGRITGFRKAN